MLSPTRRLRSLAGLIVLGAALTAGSAGAVTAASVTPTPIHDGNPTCADFGAWDEAKADPPANGVFSDGTLTVTISDFVQSSSGTPGSFDWSSNIGVDAVFVKAGNDKHHLYVYAPESIGDTDLGPQADTGNGISHVSFCDTWVYVHDAQSYDVYHGFELPATANGMTVNCNNTLCRNTSWAMLTIWSDVYLNRYQLDCLCDTKKRHVMAHELGHALGLFHHGGTLMNATWNSIVSPTSADLGAKPPCASGNNLGGLRCVYNYSR